MEQIPPPKKVKILETAEDIQERREQVLNRYEDFKQEARAKREKLEDSRRFQYFKRDADELESWIQEKLQAASDESYKDPTNLQAKIQKHQAFEAEVAAHSNAIVVLDNTGSEMIAGGHFASETIRRRLDELHRLWELLLSRLAEKGMKLQQALVLVQFLRHCDEVMFWIHDKETFVCADEFGSDLEHVEVLQRKFDEFQKDMAAQEYRVTEVNQLAERLVLEGHPERETIVKRKDELNEAWQRLRQMALMRQERLFGAHEIQRFNRDADETIAWISEKDVVLGSDDYGRDLATVQTLQRKHEGVERDLAALEDKVSTLDSEAARLAAIHADHTPAIHAKRDEIASAWQQLVRKAKERRSELESSYALHRFLADYRDLVSWMSDIRALIAADDLAKDVPGAEALLERHQEHKGEMDAREDVTRACGAAGRALVDGGHREASAVQQALDTLQRDSSALQQLWEQRRVLYLQCMDLQLFYRDTEQADAWMHKQEAFLANEDVGDSLDSVEALLKKHEDFEKSLAAQEEKIKALDEFASKLIEGQHYAADDVAQRREMLLERRAALLEKSSQRRALLEDAYKYQQFERDCDETKGWINEKLKFATDDSYLDPTNLNGKVQKHQNFEQELQANKPRVDEITAVGNRLREQDHFAKPQIESRSYELAGLWDKLAAASELKGSKLQEAAQQQQYNRAVEDIELWLSEVEGQLLSEDYGKDLTSVQNLQKKHALLEADVSSHAERIDAIRNQAEQFIEKGHFDADNIKAKRDALVARYTALDKPMAIRKRRLLDSLQAQQLFRDLDDEAAWIREKEPIIASTNRGRDLIGVQNLMKKHQAVMGEMAQHEARVEAVRAAGAALRDAVTLACRAIAASAPRFPPPLRDCFATFRERLTAMGREDISDNLISASIFLRFLCPAILSPSLFGITHEYPNARAARNLTLVAKTLQTLANFTRFQGKEAFMEFLNDFLEQEAPNMKAFLRAISTRPHDQQQQVQTQQQQQQQQDGSNRNSSASQGSTAGSENSRGEPIAAVEADPEWAPHVDLGKQLATLHGLLVDSLPKVPPGKIQELDPLSDILDELSKRLAGTDNGSMPQAADNIFRFNDPTCNTPVKQNNSEAQTNGQTNGNFAHSSPLMNKNGVQFNISPSKSNAEESKYKGSFVAVSKSPSFNLRSQTLPRNGYGSSPVNQNVNPDRYSSQYNNQEHCVNLKVVQIGFGSDQYPKGISNGVNESLERRFQERYKPNNFNQQAHFTNNYNNTERSPSSDSINHNYCSNDVQNLMRETATLDELSDLLKYADDTDIIDDKIMNKKNLVQSQSNNNNNIVNGNKTTYTNNGSNVSISGLSNVASSGYQSIATYSQSSSPIENTTHHHQPYENGGQPMSRYSQLNYQKQREKQYYDNKNEKFYPKSPVQQKIEYDIQMYGIQNFTTADNAQANTNVNSKIAPLVFTNPVYNMEDNRQSPEKKKCNENRNSKRCQCGSSSSSIDEEGLSTDNVETNSEEGSTNFNDDGRNYDPQKRNNTHRKLTRDNCNYEDVYQRSNHSHSPRIRDDELSSNSPSLRKSSKTRMPRTNPMLSYSTNQNQLNLKHFGQRSESVYESKPHHISTDSGYPMSRSESNVEEVNKEMYRLQISRSQKALFNMDNPKSSPEKYSLSENAIPETNYPLDRTYSGAKMSNSRLNEDLERHQDYFGAREKRDSPSRGMFNRETQSSEASERAPLRSERELPGREKLQRRLSLESARELTDSSDEMEDTLYSTTGRRRTSKHHRTIEQYEREIERLKCSVELLRGRLGPSESGQDHTDAKMKAIISRLICVEEELRREQRKMAAALSHKQRVIEAQEHRIAALDEANTRLLSALVHLQQRAPHPAPHPPAAHGSGHPPPHSQHSHQELQI